MEEIIEEAADMSVMAYNALVTRGLTYEEALKLTPVVLSIAGKIAEGDT
ncbi:hypothetical protein [Nonomuraea gerenzanensis]|uniref:Uncharacterized protein n=1 Tax=Nonomuraea gerenzanensis TaxID=93944 RepID=A0A1M4DVJ1_9ACTN|nr:hypothetical protein [Nonomuraea gerenzanensis]UBU12955.1 hypothetical protein LCN96_53395 [Nonomuraea gerenzanensis]SBO90594.1 hypothetical protein BN4615_P108 [Nonomuraea gerenzanensis]